MQLALSNNAFGSFFDGFQASSTQRFTAASGGSALNYSFGGWSKTLISCTIVSASRGYFTEYDNGASYKPSGVYVKQGTVILQPLKSNPLGFVIGDNADQYPNGGEKGGYWYELIGQITSTNALSLSDSAYDLTRDIAVEEIRNEVILNGINS